MVLGITRWCDINAALHIRLSEADCLAPEEYAVELLDLRIREAADHGIFRAYPSGKSVKNLHIVCQDQVASSMVFQDIRDMILMCGETWQGFEERWGDCRALSEKLTQVIDLEEDVYTTTIPYEALVFLAKRAQEVPEDLQIILEGDVTSAGGCDLVSGVLSYETQILKVVSAFSRVQVSNEAVVAGDMYIDFAPSLTYLFETSPSRREYFATTSALSQLLVEYVYYTRLPDISVLALSFLSIDISSETVAFFNGGALMRGEEEWLLGEEEDDDVDAAAGMPVEEVVGMPVGEEIPAADALPVMNEEEWYLAQERWLLRASSPINR